MDHVAIMRKSWGLIPKILSGEKTIESRWYQTKRSPWGKIHQGDTVYFKNSGEAIIAKARVSEVLEFLIKDITDAEEIIKNYDKNIQLVNTDPGRWPRLPKYCILIRLENAERIDPPFSINKKGFGIGAAWMVTDDMRRIKI